MYCFHIEYDFLSATVLFNIAPGWLYVTVDSRISDEYLPRMPEIVTLHWILEDP